MSAYNEIQTVMRCPRCGHDCVAVRTQFWWGYLDQTDYRIGEELKWASKSRMNRGKYTNSDQVIEGYSECQSCQKDFWTDIHVKDNRIVGLTVNSEKLPILPDDPVPPDR